MNTITLQDKDYRFKFNVGTLVNIQKRVQGDVIEELKNNSLDAVVAFVGYTLADKNGKYFGEKGVESLELEELIDAIEFVMTEFEKIEPKLRKIETKGSKYIK